MQDANPLHQAKTDLYIQRMDKDHEVAGLNVIHAMLAKQHI